jgi:hypothetical protein
VAWVAWEWAADLAVVKWASTVVPASKSPGIRGSKIQKDKGPGILSPAPCPFF